MAGLLFNWGVGLLAVLHIHKNCVCIAIIQWHVYFYHSSFIWHLHYTFLIYFNCQRSWIWSLECVKIYTVRVFCPIIFYGGVWAIPTYGDLLTMENASNLLQRLSMRVAGKYWAYKHTNFEPNFQKHGKNLAIPFY